MGSTRLPGKVLMRLGDKTVLEWVVRAANHIEGVDDVVVATSTSNLDGQIEKWCGENSIKCFRGSESDVLSRFKEVTVAYSADIIIRLTADCPLLDPQICSTVLALFNSENADYASNVSPADWPDGLDCEVIRAKALYEAEKEATLQIEREHVTPFIQYNRHRYKISSFSCPIPKLSSWCLTIHLCITLPGIGLRAGSI